MTVPSDPRAACPQTAALNCIWPSEVCAPQIERKRKKEMKEAKWTQLVRKRPIGSSVRDAKLRALEGTSFLGYGTVQRLSYRGRPPARFPQGGNGLLRAIRASAQGTGTAVETRAPEIQQSPGRGGGGRHVREQTVPGWKPFIVDNAAFIYPIRLKHPVKETWTGCTCTIQNMFTSVFRSWMAWFFIHQLAQWFPTGGTRTPRGTQAHCRGYVETFNNHLCYVILFENHQHGGTHGMTNRLRGYTRQKRLGNTELADRFSWQMFPLNTMYKCSRETIIFVPTAYRPAAHWFEAHLIPWWLKAI